MNSRALDHSNLDSWSEMMLFSLHMEQKTTQNKGCCWFKRRWTSTLLILQWPKHPDLYLPWFFTSVGVLVWSMMQEKPLNFHVRHATDSDCCTGLLANVTTYYCLTLQNAEASLENNGKEEYLGIMINGITIKYLNMNE